MKTFHITETSAPESLGDRGLFKLLESVSSFSLCECRGREQIVFSGTHQVLVLDHLDEAANSAAILKQVLEVQTEIQWLIVVDQRPQIPCLEHFGLIPLCHLVLGHGCKPNSIHRPDRTFTVLTVSSAVDFLKQHQLAA